MGCRQAMWREPLRLFGRRLPGAVPCVSVLRFHRRAHLPIVLASGLFSKGSPTSNVRAIPFRVAVGARITPRPPHGSVRAPLCIRLLPRVPDGETLVGPGMKDSRLWEPVVRQLRHSSPGETAFLTASAECPAPAFGDLGSKGSHASQLVGTAW